MEEINLPIYKKKVYWEDDTAKAQVLKNNIIIDSIEIYDFQCNLLFLIFFSKIKIKELQLDKAHAWADSLIELLKEKETK